MQYGSEVAQIKTIYEVEFGVWLSRTSVYFRAIVVAVDVRFPSDDDRSGADLEWDDLAFFINDQCMTLH